jgi:hypothetical protein
LAHPKSRCMYSYGDVWYAGMVRRWEDNVFRLEQALCVLRPRLCRTRDAYRTEKPWWMCMACGACPGSVSYGRLHVLYVQYDRVRGKVRSHKKALRLAVRTLRKLRKWGSNWEPI